MYTILDKVWSYPCLNCMYPNAVQNKIRSICRVRNGVPSARLAFIDLKSLWPFTAVIKSPGSTWSPDAALSWHVSFGMGHMQVVNNGFQANLPNSITNKVFVLCLRFQIPVIKWMWKELLAEKCIQTNPRWRIWGPSHPLKWLSFRKKTTRNPYSLKLVFHLGVVLFTKTRNAVGSLKELKRF